MNPLFSAGRALGKALPLVWGAKDARPLVLEAADAVARSGDASLAPVIAEMRRFPSQSSRAQDKALVAVTQHLRDDHLHARPGVPYHAFCIGHLLGETEAGLMDEAPGKPVSAQKRDRAGKAPAEALAHAATLRDGYGVSGVGKYEIDFKAIRNGLATARTGADFQAVGYLVKTYASKIGNGIP